MYPALPLGLHAHTMVPAPVVNGTVSFIMTVCALIIGTVMLGCIGMCRKDNVKIAAVIYSVGGVCAWLLWCVSRPLRRAPPHLHRPTARPQTSTRSVRSAAGSLSSRSPAVVRSLPLTHSPAAFVRLFLRARRLCAWMQQWHPLIKPTFP